MTGFKDSVLKKGILLSLILLLTAICSPAWGRIDVCTPPPSGMVAWWGGDNNALDMVGDYHGTLYGDTTYATGIVDKAFSFDGAGDYVDLPDGFANFTSGFTVGLWANPTTNGYWARFIDLGNGSANNNIIFTRRSTSNDLALVVYDGSGNSDMVYAENAITNNEWHYYAATMDAAGQVKLYRDGAPLTMVVDATYDTTTIVPTNVTRTNNYIGRSNWGGDAYYAGSMDEVVIFNRELSSSEIAAIYNARSAGKCRSCTPPPSNMVSWWGGEGDANDIIGTNHGTLQNGATFAAGKVGQAFSFDGENDYVQKVTPTGLPVGSAPRSLDLWFKTPRNLSSSTESALVQYGTPSGSNMFGLITSGNCPGKLYFYGNSNDLCGTTSILPDTWYHGAVTYDGSTLKLYLNGQLENSAGKSLNTVLNADGLTIGLRPGSTPWQGLIDEVEIFNRALSTDEIAAIYNAGSAGKCRSCTPPPPDMVSWWDGEGDASDIIGTNHGTLQNGATFAAGKVGQAFSFDGENDYVTTNLVSTAIDNITMDAWVNWGGPNYTSSEWQRIFYNGYSGSTGYGIYLRTDGTLNVLTGGVAFIGTNGQLSQGVWQHIAAVRDSGVWKFYLNANQLTLDGNNSPNPLTGGDAASIGGSSIGTDMFKGLIDEVEFFNRALSANEIAAIYNAGSAGKCTQQQYTLTVTKAGTGSGTAAATGINCGADCAESYDEGSVVALTATPATGSIFGGWSGSPDCIDGSVTMNASKSCTATFSSARDLSGSWSSIRKNGPDRRGIYTLSGSLNVSNTGALPANNVVVNVYLSSNSAYELGDTLIASLYYGSIGGKITKVKSFAVSTKTNPRGKYVIGVIDPSNIVIESNETNNSALKLVP